jgi:hypothetical protein
MKNDVEKYIGRRRRTDKTFAKDFETGYTEFKQRQLGRQADVIRLTPKDAKKIRALLKHPPKPNARLKAAVKTSKKIMSQVSVKLSDKGRAANRVR